MQKRISASVGLCVVVSLFSGRPASAVSLTLVEDGRSAQWQDAAYGGSTFVLHPPSFGADWEVQDLPGHHYPARQISSLGSTRFDANGWLDDADAQLSSSVSTFFVGFTLDAPAHYTFEGTLDRSSPVSVFTQLCTASDCAAGSIVHRDAVDPASQLFGRSFDYAGVLAPGEYWIWAQAADVGNSGVYATGGFQLVFSVVPEPRIALLAALLLAALAARYFSTGRSFVR